MKSRKPLIILSLVLSLIIIISLFTSCTKKKDFLDGLVTYVNYDASFVTKIGDYKNLKITKDISTGEQDVLEFYFEIIDGIMARCDFEKDEPVIDEIFSDLVHLSSDKVVENSNYVCFDYYMLSDGEDTGNGDTYTTVQIGSGLFIPGFEEALIGHKSGESFTITVTFPDEYPKNESLQGKPVDFNIVIHYVFPDISDEVVEVLNKYNAENSVSDPFVPTYTNKDEFIAYAKESIVDEKTKDFENSYDSLLIYNLYEESEFGEFPEDQVESFKSGIESQASGYGVSTTVYLYYCYGITTDEEFDELAKYQVAMRGIIATIVQNEKLTVTEEEYKAFINEVYESYGYESSSELVSDIGKDNLCNSILSGKVIDYLSTVATIEVVE